MTLLNLFQWLQTTPLAAFLQTSHHLIVEVVGVLHVLGLILLLASLLLINLRLLGVGLQSISASQLAKSTSPLVWIGLGLTVISGAFLLLPNAVGYYFNPAFLPKLVLLILAVAVQATLYRKVTSMETPRPVLAKATALISLTLWFGVGLAGRAIGYI
jgi:hypothetical protein